MRLTIEKVLILKSVNMFAETPEKSLAGIAAILEEQDVLSDEVIFEKGSLGKSMYIIVDGQVKVHDGDHTILTLGNRDVFGELAVLDPEPRSATVTATKDTTLFQLEQDALYELMAEHIDVARGVIKALCRRIRQQT